MTHADTVNLGKSALFLLGLGDMDSKLNVDFYSVLMGNA